MSKLATIRRELTSNSDVDVLVTKQKQSEISAYSSGWSDWWDIIVAPAQGLYKADNLQEFMVGLLSIPPTTTDAFQQFDGGMRFGKLYFDETIGKIVTQGSSTVTVTDPEIQLPDTFRDRSKVYSLDSTTDLRRRTLVRVYPDKLFALRAIGGIDVYDTHRLLPAEGRRRFALFGRD